MACAARRPATREVGPGDGQVAIRIGIDHRPAHAGQGGIAIYARELTRALEVGFPADDVVRFEHTLRRTKAPGRSLASAIATRVGRPVESATGPLDVFHLTAYSRVNAKAPIVATIHDALFVTLPDCYPPRMQRRLRGVTQLLLRDAAQVVVPSERSRRDVVERFNFDGERVHVTPLGCRPLPPVTLPSPEGPPYVLTVGTLMPRKNHERLIAAFQTLSQPDVRLVIAGNLAWGEDEIIQAAERSNRIEIVAGADDAHLARLYAGATVVAQPSLDEGFGLPVVEALAMGKPVLVGSDTTCADVAGDAALAVDVTDVEAIADGLTRLLTDDALRARLAAAGPPRAAEFTWSRTAQATHAVYELAAS